MVLAPHENQKAYALIEVPLKGSIKKLLAAMGLAFLVLALHLVVFGEYCDATSVLVGAVFLATNLFFYAIVSAAILVKKNIAWVGPVIVIKYLFLIVSVYLVWAYFHSLWVVTGMFAELLLVIVFYLMIQKWQLRRDKINGAF